MGTFKPPSYSGNIGGAIHYKVNGVTRIRTMPRKFKQTQKTKASANLFGLAASMGASIRNPIMKRFEFEYSNKIHTQFAAAIADWLRSDRTDPNNPDGDFRSIREFRFNVEGPGLPHRLKIPLTVDHKKPGLIEVSLQAFIPKETILPPPGMNIITLVIVAACADLEKGLEATSVSSEIEILFDDNRVKAQTIILEFPVTKDKLVVVAAALKFSGTRGNNRKRNMLKNYMPSGVLDAWRS